MADYTTGRPLRVVPKDERYDDGPPGTVVVSPKQGDMMTIPWDRRRIFRYDDGPNGTVVISPSPGNDDGPRGTVVVSLIYDDGPKGTVVVFWGGGKRRQSPKPSFNPLSGD
ncbi:hypothetical protein TIFTF001_042709 [Ficus carica]|uniref:Uncharacterized protein n=1 Tax=Ficus carica TaxID=3494 RepID=A0AA87ZR49_FICCA|nr:hypothetical protein TIFTF001_042709 [Ficus carica]